jgi:hypothetical protein
MNAQLLHAAPAHLGVQSYGYRQYCPGVPIVRCHLLSVGESSSVTVPARPLMPCPHPAVRGLDTQRLYAPPGVDVHHKRRSTILSGCPYCPHVNPVLISLILVLTRQFEGATLADGARLCGSILRKDPRHNPDDEMVRQNCRISLWWMMGGCVNLSDL